MTVEEFQAACRKLESITLQSLAEALSKLSVQYISGALKEDRGSRFTDAVMLSFGCQERLGISLLTTGAAALDTAARELFLQNAFDEVKRLAREAGGSLGLLETKIGMQRK